MSRVGVESALDALQLRGANVLVHTKLSAMGLASDDASWLCEAVLTHVGHSGTVVMPSFTTSRTLFDPENPALAFHPDLPVDGEIGVVAETFRRRPAVLRSNHPTHSFASVGPQSRLILSTQRDNNPLGPIKKLQLTVGEYVLVEQQNANEASVFTGQAAVHLEFGFVKPSVAVGFYRFSDTIRAG